MSKKEAFINEVKHSLKMWEDILSTVKSENTYNIAVKRIKHYKRMLKKYS